MSKTDTKYLRFCEAEAYFANNGTVLNKVDHSGGTPDYEQIGCGATGFCEAEAKSANNGAVLDKVNHFRL